MLLTLSTMINAAAVVTPESSSDLHLGVARKVNGILKTEDAAFFATHAMARDVSQLTLELEGFNKERGEQKWKDGLTIVHVYTKEDWTKYTFPRNTTHDDHALCAGETCISDEKTVDYFVHTRIFAHSTILINGLKPETDSIWIFDVKDPSGRMNTIYAYRNGLEGSTYDHPNQWFTESEVPYRIHAVLERLKITKQYRPTAFEFMR